MKKNGFTLVEVLGVLVILSVLAMISVPLINSSLNSGKEKLSKVQKKQLIKGLKNYYAENLSDFSNINETGNICKSVNELKDGGYLPDELKDPKTGKAVDDDLEVCVSKKCPEDTCKEYELVYTVVEDNS